MISFLHRCIDLDANTATKARMLLTACSCPDFIVAISTLWEMLAITKPLSVSLQKVGIDLYSATSSINSIISVFGEKRQNADKAFEQT